LIGFARFLQRVLEIHPLDNIPDSRSLAMDGVKVLGREGGKILFAWTTTCRVQSTTTGAGTRSTHREHINDPLWKVGNFLSLKATCRIRREVIPIQSSVSYGHPFRICFASSSSSNYSRIDPPTTKSNQLIEERIAPGSLLNLAFSLTAKATLDLYRAMLELEILFAILIIAMF
jgi:hypothetical protein